MIIRIEINRVIFAKILYKLKDFKGLYNIGSVYIPGDWNNWGDSPEKAGHIRANPEMEMIFQKDNDVFVWQGDLGLGNHNFKPATINAQADDDGMAPAEWKSYTSKMEEFVSITAGVLDGIEMTKKNGQHVHENDAVVVKNDKALQNNTSNKIHVSPGKHGNWQIKIMPV